ncbi:hypothetical protein AB4084_10305, partial [Lysobacter sp. 2RAB21]
MNSDAPAGGSPTSPAAQAATTADTIAALQRALQDPSLPATLRATLDDALAALQREPASLHRAAFDAIPDLVTVLEED